MVSKLVMETTEATRLYATGSDPHGGPAGHLARQWLWDRGLEWNNILYWAIGCCQYPRFLCDDMTSRPSVLLGRDAGQNDDGPGQNDDGLLRDPVAGEAGLPAKVAAR